MLNINQQSLYNLISTKLNENSYDVEFNSDLFNSKRNNYYYIDTIGQRKREVPVVITDVVGEYLNVPNANSTTNTTTIQFDVYVGTDEGSDYNTNEFQNVQYNDTLNAIEEFKNSLLAKYFPLGTAYLYMGGEDSSFTGQTSITNNAKFLYFNFIPYNTDIETIYDPTTSTSGEYVLTKTATDFEFTITTGNTISIPYTVNEEVEITITNSGSVWSITDGTNTDDILLTATQNLQTFTIGRTTGFEGLFKRLVIDDSFESSVDDVDNAKVDISTWTSKDTLVNSGEETLTSNSISNCILWSEDGNAIFGFGTLNPISDVRPVDGSNNYQAFELESTVFISNDVLFGNNFEYYLDGLQIYPIDRQHTLATETGSAQKINANYNEHVVEESSREHTLSFYYIPSKQLTSLLKHAVSGETEQNKTYTLLVQYPFFQVSYEVVLENGGTQPNINTVSTFSLTFKRKLSTLA